jgi:WD40 repeat protein
LARGAEACLEGHSGSIRALCVLPNGHLASGAHDRTIRLWDVALREISRLEVDAPIHCLAALRSNGRLIAGDQLGRLHWLQVVDDTGRYHAHWLQVVDGLRRKRSGEGLQSAIGAESIAAFSAKQPTYVATSWCNIEPLSERKPQRDWHSVGGSARCSGYLSIPVSAALHPQSFFHS